MTRFHQSLSTLWFHRTCASHFQHILPPFLITLRHSKPPICQKTLRPAKKKDKTADTQLPYNIMSFNTIYSTVFWSKLHCVLWPVIRLHHGSPCFNQIIQPITSCDAALTYDHLHPLISSVKGQDCTHISVLITVIRLFRLLLQEVNSHRTVDNTTKL